MEGLRGGGRETKRIVGYLEERCRRRDGDDCAMCRRKKLFGFGENYVVRLWIFGVLEGRRILRDIDGW